ncbi:TetR/AcrR family transcriptional regulator [Arsenicicoccus cauae]|uniref:TetR family transcriptional regulator n=1 Tax=Arsenicicoccus cauae TaxID=2663847 RepID=A0A6I3IXB7_9MICO|nr:TetR/AcrR family transcriptional regulator [Arsenicicoccus cauae]MTB73099.1 TetR family transcriptional regulator [Arsenicicoccus cauae]
MPRPKLYDDDLRGRLIATAADQVAAGGLDGLSLRRVAEEAGTSTNAVYTVFGGKDGLVGAMASEAQTSFVAAQLEAVAGRDPLDDLLALGLAYRRWAVEHASLYAVMFGGRVPPPEDCAEDGLAPLLGVVQRVADAGRLVGEDVHAAALAIWAATHGCVALELALWPDQPEELSARDFERQLAALTRAWILA